MYRFSKKSLKRLNGLHPKLIYLLMHAIKASPIDFSIIEGVRSKERQNVLFNEGKSQRDGIRVKSEHQIKDDGFGYAVDIIPYPTGFENIDNFKILAKHIKKIAKELNINIVWGGDWKNFIDMPHYELKV